MHRTKSMLMLDFEKALFDVVQQRGQQIRYRLSYDVYLKFCIIEKTSDLNSYLKKVALCFHVF